MKNKKPNSLNLNFHEKRLISIALIKANGNVHAAYALNCPDGKLSFDKYKQKVYLTHNISVETLIEKFNRRKNKSTTKQ